MDEHLTTVKKLETNLEMQNSWGEDTGIFLILIFNLKVQNQLYIKGWKTVAVVLKLSAHWDSFHSAPPRLCLQLNPVGTVSLWPTCLKPSLAFARTSLVLPTFTGIQENYCYQTVNVVLKLIWIPLKNTGNFSSAKVLIILSRSC